MVRNSWLANFTGSCSTEGKNLGEVISINVGLLLSLSANSYRIKIHRAIPRISAKPLTIPAFMWYCKSNDPGVNSLSIFVLQN